MTPGSRVFHHGASGAHRVAALALYRALLSAARDSARTGALDAKLCDDCITTVRRRFRAKRYLKDPQKVRKSFISGYQALHHLEYPGESALDFFQHALRKSRSQQEKASVAPDVKSNGNTSTVSISEQVQQALNTEDTERLPNLEVLKQESELPVDASEVSVAEHQVETSSSEECEQTPRPRSKPRSLILTNANGIPFIRYKKPQPESLAAYIAGRVQQRDRRHWRIAYGNEMVELAKTEDTWDDLLKKEFGQAAVGTDQTWGTNSWARAYYEEIGSAVRALERERLTNAKMAAAMWDIVKESNERDDEDSIFEEAPLDLSGKIRKKAETLSR